MKEFVIPTAGDKTIEQTMTDFVESIKKALKDQKLKKLSAIQITISIPDNKDSIIIAK